MLGKYNCRIDCLLSLDQMVDHILKVYFRDGWYTMFDDAASAVGTAESGA